jgi:hypothetical protein
LAGDRRRLISDGRTESPLHTVAILEVLDEARRQIETQ